ncbi:MAG: FAD-dependent oxidoreductase [Micromonosporaceae bacterium]|nr:FAD-dependent oxidoreductase [Micromonosporaceae bacterium]
MSPERIVVVGASLGAVSFIDRLRRRGGRQRITLIGAEIHLPYDRPPLSKQFLADATPTLLKPAEWYAEQEVELRLGVAATELRTDPFAVVAGGERVEADQVVIATGARARTLPGVVGRPGLYQLRELDDAVRLAAALGSPGRMVVLGAGFIGLEVSAAAARRGWQVIVLERAESPLARVLGADVGRLCVRSHLREGVELRCGASVTSLTGDTTVEGVRLDDGTDIPADAVVVGIGAAPNTEWLRGSGVMVDNGVVCDAAGRASLPGVWAVGDVARWPNAVTGRHDRVEQWQAARDQGTVVADAMLGGSDAGWATPPYFWSDLFDAKVQFVGHCDPRARHHIVERGRRAVVIFGHDELEGVLSISAPRVLAMGRRLLTQGSSFEAAKVWAAGMLPPADGD